MGKSVCARRGVGPLWLFPEVDQVEPCGAILAHLVQAWKNERVGDVVYYGVLIFKYIQSFNINNTVCLSFSRAHAIHTTT